MNIQKNLDLDFAVPALLAIHLSCYIICIAKNARGAKRDIIRRIINSLFATLRENIIFQKSVTLWPAPAKYQIHQNIFRRTNKKADRFTTNTNPCFHRSDGTRRAQCRMDPATVTKEKIFHFLRTRQ